MAPGPALVVALLVVALVCCSCSSCWAQASGGPAEAYDQEFSDFVAKHNIQLSDRGLPHNYVELWGELFDENVQTGKWLVFFSVQWSSESRRMQSIWEEFTQQGHRQYPDLKFAQVRCDHEKSLCTDRLMLTKFPFIMGVNEGNATVMREPESNAGLHEFVNTGWALRGPGDPLPPRPNPYYLRYKRFMNGLEHAIHVPVYHLATAIAVCAALLVLLTCYSLCGTGAASGQAPRSSSKPSGPAAAACPSKKRAPKNKASSKPKAE